MSPGIDIVGRGVKEDYSDFFVYSLIFFFNPVILSFLRELW